MADLENTNFIDLPTRTYQVKNGRIIDKIDGLEAMKQLIDKTLRTERFEYEIYTGYFGVEFVDLLGQPYSFAKTAVKRRIESALLVDERITSLTDFRILSFEDGVMHLYFVVSTIYGTVTAEREVRVGD